MIWLFLGIIYGMGFAITLMGGVLYVLILGSLHSHVSLWKFVLGIVGWPITWGYMLWKLWRVRE